MPDMNIENEFNFRTAIESGINLFVGSGFPTLARDVEGHNLPTDQQLATELASTFFTPNNLNLEQVCAIIEYTNKTELKDYLIKRFSVESFDDRYEVFDKLAVKTIFTTIIDNFFYLIYSESKSHYLNNLENTGPSYRDKKAVDIVPLQGSVLDPRKPLKVGSASLTSTFATDPDRWRVLKDRLRQFPTLFWGYSVQDSGILQSLVSDSVDQRRQKDRWIVIDPLSDDGTINLFRAFNFQVIFAGTSALLDYLTQAASEIKPVSVPVTSFSTKELFPNDGIPEYGTVPVRPINDFFLGAPPQWSDIYSGSLYRTSYYNQVRNSINSDKDTLIIGVPGCGKTTLLMQLATENDSVNYKLMSDSITLEKARLIWNRLQGARALIFIDNFADSLDALEFFSSKPEIQVVGADRDYNFGFVNHRIKSENFKIIDITELSMSDIQRCFQSIPEVLRRTGYERPDTGRVDPSLFEIIEHNVKGSTLKQRYVSVLKNLGKQDPNLRDLLVVISYVSRARVPATLDIVLAFMRDVTTDYRKVYKMLESLGAMISDSVGSELFQLGEDQDYFVPRSVILGEAILENVKNDVLKNVLVRFHKNVSPYRIYRYDTFRKYAFDHKIMVRAFPKAKEGSDFYEELYYRDESPYMLQQGALYLSDKSRYTEAFDMIDRAINASGGRIWSIRNSHAIILFKANILHYNKPGAKEQLGRSMQILTECYTWDKRKPFHALTFADQALNYLRVYGDEDAYKYLETAQKWLSDEARRSPWNRNVRRLLSAVERVINH